MVGIDNRVVMVVGTLMSSRLYPDHSSLPVEELRRLLSIPMTPATLRASYGLECEHCESIAIHCDDAGEFEDGTGGNCLFCSFPGHVVVRGSNADGSERAQWCISEENDAYCLLASCDAANCIKARNP